MISSSTSAQSPGATPVAFLPNELWVLLAAAILLLPALLWGRPFVFYDTPNYWGWGRDILEALQKPWPRPGQSWPSGRPLHGWELGAHGASPADLRFSLTLVTSRSAFYAVPFYLLTRWGGLWLVAVVQAVTAAWVVKVALRVMTPTSSGLAYIGVVAALTATSSLGFETAFAMPDLYGGLAVLAAPVLIVYWRRLGWAARLGLLAIVIYAVLAHAENGLNVAAAVLMGGLLYWRADGAAALGRVTPIAVALAIGLVVAASGGMILKSAFGRPVHMAPFVASRVLADGAAQQYLRTACPRARLAACDLTDIAPVYPEYYLWIYPLERPPSAHVSTAAPYDRLQFRRATDAEADQRERFVDEQVHLVLGALQTDGLRQARAALINGAAAFINFGVNRDFDSLQGLLQERTQRRGQVAAIVPGGGDCARFGGKACGRFDLGLVAALEYAVVVMSFVFLGAGLIRRSAAAKGELGNFLVLTLGLVLANAFLCGALSGPYDRYQARVEWLIPFGALALVVNARRGRLVAGSPAENLHRAAGVG